MKSRTVMIFTGENVTRKILWALSHNERYTFFRFLEKDPFGYLGETVTPDRTIATDPEYFRKEPWPSSVAQACFQYEWTCQGEGRISRFCLSQDKGAAIKGPGRVDLFCGFGEKAEKTAGTLKERGELYLLLKK